ncbi:MAG: tetratricopeptide repeat protein [Candidatus Obscuribacter sp.]|nr:tetratricopeptide repeat protein [Candidatus Obscuribacter sp.]
MNGEDCYTGFCINTVTNLASAYLEQGDKQLAEALLEHAYDHARAFPTHPDNVHLLDCYEQLLAGSERAHELPDLKAWVRPIQIGEDPAG